MPQSDAKRKRQIGKMDPIESRTAKDLLHRLREIHISVPPRTEGRTTEHIERWTMCRFLASFAETGLFDYPVRIVHRDRPDFVLTTASGCIGIEIVEAIHPLAAEVDFIAEKINPSGVRFVPSLEMGKSFPRKDRKDEIRKMAEGTTPIRPSMGYGWEKNWAEAMFFNCRRKEKIISGEGFRRFPHNWLLIDDNWQPANIDEGKSISILSDKFAEHDNQFDQVFIERSRNIWQYDGRCFSEIPIIDLWSGQR